MMLRMMPPRIAPSRIGNSDGVVLIGLGFLPMGKPAAGTLPGVAVMAKPSG